MSALLAGGLVVACAIVGLFFLRYWKATRDSFFLYFAFAFWLQGGQWFYSGLTGPENEYLPFAYLLTGGLAHGAAVVHDWLYTTHEVSRAVADAVFHEAALECGVSGWQAWLMWAGVRLGGGDAWDAPGPDQPVLVQQQISAAEQVAP